MAKEKVKKSRYWGFIIYPDSMPSNWIEILQQTGLQIAVSPLHCYDTNEDGTLKKAHRHVLLCFDGPTTLKNIEYISEKLNGTQIICINSVKGMYRYHIHQDNPEKFQYNEDDRVLINGFSISDYASLTTSEESILIQQVILYIHTYEIYEYSYLVDFLMREDIQAFDYVVHHTLLFNTFCNSRRNKIKQATAKKKNTWLNNDNSCN